MNYDLNEGAQMGLGIAGAVIGGIMVILAILAVILFIAALISILMNHQVTGGGKFLWILGVLYMPVFGAVAWFVVGKKGTVNRILGIDKHPEGEGEGEGVRRAAHAERPGTAPHFGGASPGHA
ncbi:phospholipase D-like protein [Murinocardiopsis flavida]|uniref:Phospholipase D-like protein n=1 Tax=Murinocardiopsis flavida TaxID=645275 RepID=A0A2P8DR88_9ACTN|nr:PLD nuclease N-terminal domain-containing protein [Murinocardiopsis flavida]PSK99694.1 phospholipase D-like protein [Murinocardiopsis flavida]